MIGNLNSDSFLLECVICGREEGISLVAHRGWEKGITGFLAVCPDHTKQVYGGSIQLLLPKARGKELKWQETDKTRPDKTNE